MNRVVVSGCLSVLLLSGTHAFAQFKNPARIAKNLANVERVVTRATKPAVIGRPVVTGLPTGVVPGNSVGLLRVKMPQVATPVTQSYTHLLHKGFEAAGPLHAYPTPESYAGITANSWAMDGKRVLFDDQTQLAKELDNFYQGAAEVYAGPDGRNVKLYALPVDGILYKPVGYSTPVVLNSNEYFVIFDVESQTGKIADNIPEVVNLYRRIGEDEIYGEFEDYEVEPGIGSWRPKDPAQYYKWQRDLMRDNPHRAEDWRNGNYPARFESQNDLGSALHHFYGNDVPKVQKRFTQDVFNVYELPVPGLVYQGEGQLEPTVLVPSAYVVLYNEKTGGQIVERDALENSLFFEFVK